MSGKVSYTRQLGIVDPANLICPVTIIGVGGIGSNAADLLTRMGVDNITVYDDDIVEPENLPSQAFGLGYIGQMKVEALADHVKKHTGKTIIPVPERYTGQASLSGIVISGVDTMAARYDIWSHMKYNINVPLYIDGRMGGVQFIVFPLNPSMPDEIKYYESQLFPDDEALDIPCTERAIVYNTWGIASHIGNLVGKFANGIKLPKRTIFDYKQDAVYVYR